MSFFLKILSISNSSSSLTICDKDCRSIICWEERAFMTADWSMTEWNTLWISDSVFRQKKCELIFLTMMYLTFFTLNFLYEWFICMFFKFSQTLSSFLKLYDCCLFQFTVFFCICWVTVIVICAHSVTSFIFYMIWSAFFTELLTDHTSFNFSNSCRDFIWYSWNKKKKLTSVKMKSWLFMTSSVMRSRFAQLFWL